MGCGFSPSSGTENAQEEQCQFSKPDEEKVTSVFNQYKTEDTAVIPEDKIYEAVTTVGYTQDSASVAKIVSMINVQKTLNADEFYRLCYVLQNFDASSKQYDKLVFMLADTDYSGKISETEMKAFLEKVESQIDSKPLKTAISQLSGSKITFTQFNQITKKLGIDFSKYFE